ncbi:magnesium chelatase subunit D [Mesorhizobium sp. VNQ89]|uniref:magnesium chelatase subunit D n=1 Tax=Mesorhizobium quangtriensis TaxID=3157709 RepID=UPI0032B751D9
MTSPAAALPSLWDDALLAAALITIDPKGLAGVHVRSRSGPVRDRWLEILIGLVEPEAPIRRISAGIPDIRLTGGLDIGLTLDGGRPVVERGALASADGGMVVLGMAERMDISAAAVIGMALDNRSVRLERDGISTSHQARFALIALDEGIDDEGLPTPLADRLGLRIDLNAVALRDMLGTVSSSNVEQARKVLPTVVMRDELVNAMCSVSISVGIRSIRAALHLSNAARAAAALRGSETVDAEDAATALRLVLGLRAGPPEQAAEPEPETESEADRSQPAEEQGSQQEYNQTDALQDILVAAKDAVLPKHLMAGLQSGTPVNRIRGDAGKAGAVRNKARRGRAIGTSDKPPVPGARLDVLATLRQAAPWQRIRAASAQCARRLHIRKSDFRYLRFREKTGTTVIFAVDASGSAALERLAESKGAVELLLAECYVRRDQVALIAFRGRGSEVLLAPTRSLVRAKRSLSALPGGGGTPLASGILTALAMATGLTQKGQSVITVFLTDGRGNIAIDGGTAKESVAADTEKATRMFRAAGARAIVIDTAKRPQPRVETLARDLGAEHLVLPRAEPKNLAREIGMRMEN